MEKYGTWAMKLARMSRNRIMTCTLIFLFVIDYSPLKSTPETG
jgi:hypothetical protein